jgi:hypothetical protein
VTRFRDQRPHVGFTSLHVETLLRRDRTTLHRWDALRQVELPARPSSPTQLNRSDLGKRAPAAA